MTKGNVQDNNATPIVSALDPRSDLPGALAAWQALLGEANVLVDDATLDRYARTTSSSSRRPAAVVKPATRDEVVQLVKVARRCKTPLYPISTGQNWGYGDACAVYPGQVIVDLGRMNRIEHVDAELGYAVIEPGVTQGQLSSHLAANGVPFWIDCTGAGPNSSLIGNIVERGFGHTPYGNRFQTISGMEVVLGTGELLRTGFGHYAGAKTTHLYPFGIGPYLDGIFTQSNFGIVTKLGLWLLPVPESFCPYIVLFEEDEDLLDAIAPLRELRMSRVLQSVPHIANDLRALASDAPFPRDRLPGNARLTPEIRAALRKEAGIGAWSMSGAFYGPSRQVALHKRLLKRALSGVNAQGDLSPGPQTGGRAAVRAPLRPSAALPRPGKEDPARCGACRHAQRHADRSLPSRLLLATSRRSAEGLLGRYGPRERHDRHHLDGADRSVQAGRLGPAQQGDGRAVRALRLRLPCDRQHDQRTCAGGRVYDRLRRGGRRRDRTVASRVTRPGYGDCSSWATRCIERRCEGWRCSRRTPTTVSAGRLGA